MIGFEIGAWFWTLIDSAVMLTDRRGAATPVVPDTGFGVHVGRSSEPTPRPRFFIERRAYLREEELPLQVSTGVGGGSGGDPDHDHGRVGGFRRPGT
jgi:hypothetical protein